MTELPEVPSWLPDSILEELADKEHGRRKHGRGGYAGGCRGPLCSFGNKMHARARYALAVAQSDKPFRQRERAKDTETEELLQRSTDWFNSYWKARQQILEELKASS